MPLKIKIIVPVFFSVLAAAVFLCAHEVIENIKYNKWKCELEDRASHCGMLKIVTAKSADPVLVWEYRPYGECKNIKMNRYGFRDLDYESPKKPEGVRRIAFVGDSVTVGLKIDFNDIFTSQYEKIANEKRKDSDKKIQVLNFAVDGYDTIQVAENLRQKVPQFSPDKVVYVMCINDFDFDDSSSRKKKYFNKPRLFFWEKLKKAPFDFEFWMGKDFELLSYDWNHKAVFKSILSMRDFCRKNGFEYEVVIVPALFRKTLPNFDLYHLGPMHDGVREFCGKNNIPVLDLLPIFRERKFLPGDIALDNWHFNAKGHRLAAEILAENIR